MKKEFNKLYNELKKENKDKTNYFFKLFLIVVIIILFYYLLIYKSIIPNTIIGNIFSIIIIVSLLVINVILTKKKYKSDKNFIGFKYSFNYMRYFLENYMVRIFDKFNYSIITDDGSKTYLQRDKIYEEVFFTSTFAINNQNINMVASKDYSIKNDYSNGYDKRTFKQGIVININMPTNFYGEIKYVSFNNFDNVYAPFVNNGNKVKLNDKNLKKFYKVYGEDLSIRQDMISGEFAELLCKISKKLSKIPFMPPDIKIEINENGIKIFIGLLSMFNDILPDKIKTFLYYKKFIYIRKLCELLIIRFKV